MMSREEYEAKRQRRYDRLLAAAEKASRESAALIQRSHDMASMIPFGQPILVGHYSEGRDRRYRARIENSFRRGYDLYHKAETLRERAKSTEANRAIFSDDPDAVEKLDDKLARLQKRQEMMKEANRRARKGDRQGLLDMGFSEMVVDGLLKPDWSGHPGFPQFELTNNGANIRRIQDRIKTLMAHAQDQEQDVSFGEVRVLDNVDANRIQVFFPGKPSSAVREVLKRNGFRWTPSSGCWQSYRTRGFDWASGVVREAIGAGHHDDSQA